MIKAEKCKDGIKVDFSCSPLVRALEFGNIVRKFYDRVVDRGKVVRNDSAGIL